MLGSAALAACEPAPAPAPPPDILLVVMDTVRADRSSAYGYARETSPQLEALAGSGVRFDDVTYPSPWTWPSHAAIFTGAPPWVSGAHRTRDEEKGFSSFGTFVSPMRGDLPTLAERMSAQGYQTVAAVSNPWLAQGLGLTRGYERVITGGNDQETIEAAREAMRDGDRPLFLFVNLMGAHCPWEAAPAGWLEPSRELLTPEAAPDWARPYLMERQPGLDLCKKDEELQRGLDHFRSGSLRIPPEGMVLLNDLYDAGVLLADAGLARLVRDWVGTRPRGAVIATSDHGEFIGERGLLDHGLTLHPEQLKVPLVMALPGRIPAGTRFEGPVSLIQLYPTVLDIAGADDGVDGSLLALLDGRAQPTPIQAAVFPLSPGTVALLPKRGFDATWYAWREGDEALLFSDAGHRELYDLSSDPDMLHDLAPAQPERATSLERRAADRFEDTEVQAPIPALDDTLRQRLEELGYLG
jgi:arylsulfatase A-like enzyme